MLIFLLLQFYFSTSHLSAQVGARFSFQIFYDQLSPYGSWINHADYGFVWHPQLIESFMPYGNNGYWILTEFGWTWVSNYSWGWAPFHYGRWFYEPYYGWLWVPGDEWSPGWVTWRRSSGYYGWAPIGPGINLNYAFSNDYYVPDHYWHFVPDRHFGNEHAENHYVGLVGFANIFKRSQVISNFRNDEHGRPIYNKGPDKVSVELHTKRTFRELAIKTMDKAGQQVKKEEVSLFMPPIKKEIVETERSAPARVMQWKSDEPLQQKKEAPRQITPAPVIKHDEQPRIISSPVIINDERRQMPIPETKNEVQQPITPARVVAPPRVNNDQNKIERSEEHFPAQAPVQHAPINQPVIIERPRSIPPSYVPPKTNPIIQPRLFEPVERARPNIQRPEKSAPIKQAPPIKQTAPRKQSGRDIRNDG